MLVDSHCHLDHARFAGERDAIVERARAAGVGLMQTIGTRLSTFERTLEVANADPAIVCSVGVHPHDAGKEVLRGPEPLLEHAGHPKVVGIGEAGLDYYYRNSTPEAQAQGFRAHIAAARRSGLPLIVHTRDADEDTLAILREGMAEGRFTGVVHCYSSSPALGHGAAALGLYLGIGGILTFKRSEALRATVREVPLDRLLLETDAPYLAPEPMRGQRNEPAYVAEVAAVLAALKGLEVEEVAATTTANFFRLFSKAEPARPSCA